MKLQFLAYTHEIQKNGKTIKEDSLPTTITDINELHKYTYEFFVSDNYLLNFSASSEIGQYDLNNFHIEITKVFPEVPLSKEEFLIYEKEKQNHYYLQHNQLLDEDDIACLKEDLKEYYEEKNVDNIIAYHQQQIRKLGKTEHFVYPICSKNDLCQLLENIKTINFIQYTKYDILMPKDLETQLQGVIIEQNIIKNSNSLTEFYNSKNHTEAEKEIRNQEDEEDSDRLWIDFKAKVEYDNLSLGEKISRNVKKVFK